MSELLQMSWGQANKDKVKLKEEYKGKTRFLLKSCKQVEDMEEFRELLKWFLESVNKLHS